MYYIYSINMKNTIVKNTNKPIDVVEQLKGIILLYEENKVDVIADIDNNKDLQLTIKIK